MFRRGPSSTLLSAPRNPGQIFGAAAQKTAPTAQAAKAAQTPQADRMGCGIPATSVGACIAWVGIWLGISDYEQRRAAPAAACGCTPEPPANFVQPVRPPTFRW